MSRIGSRILVVLSTMFLVLVICLTGAKTVFANDGNISFTVPSSINFVVKADGTLIGPSNAGIVSTGSALHVESVTTTQSSPFTFKDTLSASDENAVSLEFGTSADRLHAQECLTGKTVSDDSWKIPAAGQVGISFSGNTSGLSADVTQESEFGQIIWEVAPDAFTVTYDANGGSGSMSADVVEPGASYVAKANGFTAPTGSVFDGWNTAADGSGTAYAVDAPVSVSADMMLYAQWFNPHAGAAYAVLDDAGTLTLFRSENTYNAGTGQTVMDIAGNSYIGQVYTNIENQTGTNYDSAFWHSQRKSIKKVAIAPNQVISPVNCAYWFSGCSNLSDTIELSSLDTSHVTNMKSMFDTCLGSDFTAPDVSEWDTSNVTDMNSMFAYCYGARFTAPDMSKWNTSKVMDMSWMFANCYGDAFTAPDVSEWDTSKVISMYGMFNGCSGAGFTAPNVSKWSTSNVTDMSWMFAHCSGARFTAPDVSKWNTSSVTNMRNMFYDCYGARFTAPDVSKWNTSNVTNMHWMFQNCRGAGFTAPDVSKWNTSKVTDMNGIFHGCSSTGFTSIDVSGWDISKVTDMSDMFRLCSNLETIYVAPDADWNASSTLTSFSRMFDGCSKLKGGNGTIYNSSYIDKVRARVDGLGGQPGYFTAKYRNGSAYAVLDSAGTLTLFRSETTYSAGTGQTVTDVAGNSYTGQVYTNIENQTGTSLSSAPWYSQRKSIEKAMIAPNQVINPVNCAGWFYDCTNLSDVSDLSALDTSNVTSMYYMFYQCKGANFTAPDVSNWDTSKVTNMGGMFGNCNGLAFTAPDVSNWNTSNVTNMGSMFYYCSGSAFTAPDVSDWDTSKVTKISNMFGYCRGDSFTAPDVSKWNTSNITSMGGMFSGCSGAVFTAPDVSKWDTSKVTNMNSMFSGCSGAAFTAPDVSKWDISNVTSMSSMFSGCYGDVFTAPDVSKWNTSKVTNMSYMFEYCSGDAFTAPDVSKWDISKVTNMNSMFCDCYGAGFTAPDVSKWNTSNVTSMQYMFADCFGDGFISIDVSGWNISKVTDMYGMFCYCSNLETIYAAPNADWNASTVLIAHSDMFEDCDKLVGGNGTMFNSAYVDKTRARVDGLGRQPGYFTAKPSAGTNSMSSPTVLMSLSPVAHALGFDGTDTDSAPDSLTNLLQSLDSIASTVPEQVRIDTLSESGSDIAVVTGSADPIPGGGSHDQGYGDSALLDEAA